MTSDAILATIFDSMPLTIDCDILPTVFLNVHGENPVIVPVKPGTTGREREPEYPSVLLSSLPGLAIGLESECLCNCS